MTEWAVWSNTEQRYYPKRFRSQWGAEVYRKRIAASKEYRKSRGTKLLDPGYVKMDLATIRL